MICNLLQNAIKYTPRGGRIRLFVQREGRRAVVRVGDTGRRDHLRDAAADLRAVHPGRELADPLGGGLGPRPAAGAQPRRAARRRGRGGAATGRGRAPNSWSACRCARARRRPGPPAARTRRAPVAGDAPALRILIVEDNLDGRESLRDLLEIWGHEVELAEDGRRGGRAGAGEPARRGARGHRPARVWTATRWRAGSAPRSPPSAWS